jgi:anaerobic magnesium-protoporphyrin IX monomethyl ester cyclase
MVRIAKRSGKMKKKFLFITPPYERLLGLTVESVPLGLLYLATVVRNAGHDARVFDADTTFGRGDLSYTNLNRAKSHSMYKDSIGDDGHPAWKEIRAILSDYKPDFVGISMMTPIFASCRKVAEIAREVLPGAVIMAGGPHVTILRERGLVKLPQVDVAFVGEAEETILDYVDTYLRGGNMDAVAGIIYRKNGKLCATAPRGRIQDLDALPIPDRRLLVNEKKYSTSKLGLIMAGRGCPFQCAFCASVPLWERRVKLRSPDNLMKEIDYLVEMYGIRTFAFWDDTFTVDRRIAIGFCKRLYRKYGPRRLRWACNTNINCIDDEVLFWMKHAGCRTILIGVESGSDRILRIIKKGITTDQVRKAVKAMKKRGFWVAAFFIVGLPHETENDIRKTIDFIKEIRPDSMNMTTFTPHPGTELYDYVVSRGLFSLDDEFSAYENIGHHSLDNFFADRIPKKRFEKLRDEALRVSTQVSAQMTFRKYMLVLERLDWEKVKSRLKRFL